MDALDDSGLVQKALEVMPWVVPPGGGYDFTRHTDGQRRLYCVYDFRFQVRWNGFDGFFLNTRGRINEYVLEGLAAFGAHSYRDLLLRALESQGREEVLDQLDHEFYNMPGEKLMTYMSRYIQTNSEEFF
jgi:hypothetical protein